MFCGGNPTLAEWPTSSVGRALHVKLVMLWLPITSMEVQGDEVEFTAGHVK